MTPAPAPPPTLAALLRAEMGQPLPPTLAAIADAARERFGEAVAAVLVYGSCLREGNDDDKIVDLYLLVDRYRAAYGPGLAAAVNRLLPPNVYYLEADFAGRTVRAKYAVVALDHFERLVGAGTFHSYFWARFAQPTALAWCRDEATRERLVASLARAILTLIAEARPLQPPGLAAEAAWERAFAATYGCELRAEGAERARQLVLANRERYAAIAALVPLSEAEAPCAAAVRRARRRWAWRRRLGKLLSVLRLAKSAFTFADGAAYLAWKIGRHAGVSIELTPWQRRHPLLAAPRLALRLYRQGAFR